MRKIDILDTTLRDGEQAPGNSMLLNEKIEMAKQLEKLGVDIIEAGFPAVSQNDLESVRQIALSVTNSTICALSRCKQSDIDMCYEALKDAKKSRIHLFIASSEIHMEYKLHMTREQVLEKIKENVLYAKGKFDEIQFSFEDATRSDMTFLKKCVKLAVETGVDIINLPDTVGYSYPTEIHDMFTDVMKLFPNVRFSAHCHNDLGMAVANTLSGVEAGVSQVECTINGFGERAGNTALEEVIMALYTRKEHFAVETNINLKQLLPSSQLLCDITGMKLMPSKPVVGKNAFKHESGIHQQGVIANRKTYEILDPADLGIVQNEIVLGKHSGKHALKDYLDSLDIDISKKELDELFKSFKELADKKKKVTQKDIMYLLLHGKINQTVHAYTIKGYAITTVEGKPSFAQITLNSKDGIEFGESIGDGTLDAVFKAINQIIGKDFNLLDWSSSAVTEGEDAVGVATLRLSLDGKEVTGRGASTDTVEASIKAYINACNKLV